MDLYNREIVAYAISKTQDTKFMLDTLNQLDLELGATLTQRSGFLSTPQKLMIMFVKKKVLPTPCPEREHQRTTPASSDFIPF